MVLCRMKTIPVPVIGESTSLVDERGLPIRLMGFSSIKAAEILTLVSCGKSLHKICSREDMPSFFEIALWKKQSPKFSDMLRNAKRIRVEKLSEDLVEIAGELKERVVSSGGEIKASLIDRLVRITERVSSIDAPEQGVGGVKGVRGGEDMKGKPVQMVVENPYKGHHEDVNLDIYRENLDE